MLKEKQKLITEVHIYENLHFVAHLFTTVVNQLQNQIVGMLHRHMVILVAHHILVLK